MRVFSASLSWLMLYRAMHPANQALDLQAANSFYYGETYWINANVSDYKNLSVNDRKWEGKRGAILRRIPLTIMAIKRQ
jgi:hypothetical protein